MSKLYFRYGAMNSGKSTHLMQVAHNYEERGMRVILIKPSTDKKERSSAYPLTNKVVIISRDWLYDRLWIFYFQLCTCH